MWNSSTADMQQILPLEGLDEPRLVGVRSGDVVVPAKKRTGPRGIAEVFGQIHLADRRGCRLCQMRGGHVAQTGAAGIGAVEKQDAGAGSGDIAGGDPEQGGGTIGVAAHGLALQALAQPHQRGPRRIHLHGAFDVGGIKAGEGGGALRGGAVDVALNLVPAERRLATAGPRR